jgi:hypothetical protein
MGRTEMGRTEMEGRGPAAGPGDGPEAA